MKKHRLLRATALTILLAMMNGNKAFAWKTYDERLLKYLKKDLGKVIDGKDKVINNKHGCHYSVQPYATDDRNRNCARYIVDGKDPKLPAGQSEQIEHFCTMIGMGDLTCDFANDQYWWWMAGILDTGSLIVAQVSESVYAGQIKDKSTDYAAKHKTEESTKASELSKDANKKDSFCDIAMYTQGAAQWYCAITKVNEMKALRQSVAYSSELNHKNLKDMINAIPNNLNQSPGAPVAGGVSGGTNSVTGSDTRGDSVALNVKEKEKGFAKIDSSAIAGIKDDFLEHPGERKFNESLQKMKDLGMDTDKFMSDVEKTGVASAIENAFGGRVSPDVIAEVKKADKFVPKPTLAFESATKYNVASAKKGNPAFNFFGARSVAAEGGLEALKFGGSDGDIFHAGTNLSIFEIVSRKTKTVTGRLE